MIKSRYNKTWLWFYSSWFRLLQKIYFHKISVITTDIFPEGQSVLLLQNHFSYYDGYWSMYLCNKIFRRVRKNSRELIESLNYANELLQDPLNVVTIYPSGEIISHHQQNFPFQQGFARLACHRDNNSLIAMAVVLVDHFSLARPEIRVYLKNYTGERTAESIELAYHSFYKSCITKQTE